MCLSVKDVSLFFLQRPPRVNFWLFSMQEAPAMHVHIREVVVSAQWDSLNGGKEGANICTALKECALGIPIHIHARAPSLHWKPRSQGSELSLFPTWLRTSLIAFYWLYVDKYAQLHMYYVTVHCTVYLTTNGDVSCTLKRTLRIADKFDAPFYSSRHKVQGENHLPEFLFCSMESWIRKRPFCFVASIYIVYIFCFTYVCKKFTQMWYEIRELHFFPIYK